MKDLLGHYQAELAALRDLSADFADRHPRIAGRLRLSGDVGQDPHVERLIQSVALLAARVHKRLDDDFPLVTESLLEVLYPHYLQPFPSCALARFDLGGQAAQLSTARIVERGTMLVSAPVAGVKCRFRTCFDVALAPLRVAAVSYHGSMNLPAGTPVPDGATALLSVKLRLDSPQCNWQGLGLNKVRLALEGEASQVAVLREALFGPLSGVRVQTSEHGPWAAADAARPQMVGLGDDEALIDADPRTHVAYRLLTEFFAFPEKFNFVDLPLPDAVTGSTSREVTLHYALAGTRSDRDTKLLGSLSERNLLTGTTPIVNAFPKAGISIRVNHKSDRYAVLPDARHASGHEVLSVDKVYRLKQSPQGEAVEEFQPLFSLAHERLVVNAAKLPGRLDAHAATDPAARSDAGDGPALYWTLHRDEALAERSPGHEALLSLVDLNFSPGVPSTDTLSLEVTATNRDLPSRLEPRGASGDLALEGGGSAGSIRLLRKPSKTLRFPTGPGTLWRLVSHLSVNHLSLSRGGLPALKEMLRLYDLPASAQNKRLVDALVDVSYEAVTACLPGNPFPAFVRGMHVRLRVDDTHFAASGMRLFVQVLEQFLALNVHINSFVQLTVHSSHEPDPDNVLVACPPRTGQSPLL